ncbi:MAG: carbohydrate ABC transporter permease [Fimbriimonadaceae bacterium]|nr:carbohydrate ABC transporter permease [Fimbriimonadaceae bacterium]
MRQRSGRRLTLPDLASFLLTRLGMGLFLAAVILPLLWVLISSVKSSTEIFGSPWSLPESPQWSNYSGAWGDAGIGRHFLNSLVVCVATLVLLLPIGSMAAYVFAKYPFRGSKSLFSVFLGGMMFPNLLVIIPVFLLLKSLPGGSEGLVDTKTGLVLVYVAFSLSFTVFVMSGFFEALPDELGEAAMLDGCGHSGIFWKVMFPLARPGMIVVGIFNAIGLWNEYNLAVALIHTPENLTLPLALADLTTKGTYESDWGMLFAAMVIVMLPIIVVYWIFREKIHETMLAGAIKG